MFGNIFSKHLGKENNMPAGL